MLDTAVKPRYDCAMQPQLNSLFATTDHHPLAERLRPRGLGDVVGQDLTVLERMLATGQLQSVLLWGPPGCGKTTLARILAEQSGFEMEVMSAVQSGVADAKKVFERARERLAMGKRTILFVDEIHRFNRAQQDAFLPVVEDGTILLVGATTENPSFELNAALLSRCKLVILKRLEEGALAQLLARAEAHYDYALSLTEEAKAALYAMADGDGRYMLNLVEELYRIDPQGEVDAATLGELVQKRVVVYDKHQDSHYNLISALHKSLRGSDTDAALYWFNRMLAGGEDPLYIARRLVRFAVEDIGMADPQALVQANAAKEAYQFLGSPEGELALAQAVVYLGTAPKSNAQYVAQKAAMRSAQSNGSLSPPKHILNAPTKMMQEIGYGEGYQYDHDAADGFSGQDYFPDDMARETYYQPKEVGFEREVKKRQDYWAKLRKKR